MDDRLRRDRKYTAFWGVFLMSAVMGFWGVISGSEYVTVVGIVYGSYMAGNVGEHASKAWQMRGESRPDATVERPEKEDE